jgi:hypothetical protein
MFQVQHNVAFALHSGLRVQQCQASSDAVKRKAINSIAQGLLYALYPRVAHLLLAKLCQSWLIAVPLDSLLNIPSGQPVSDKNDLFINQKRKMVAINKCPGGA